MRIDTPSINASWKKVPAKFVFSRKRRPVRPEDEIVTAFRDGEVTLRTNRRTDGFTNALVEHGYQGVRTGDLVIHSMDAFAGAIGVSDSDGKASPVVLAYRTDPEDDTLFFAYWLRAMSDRGFILSLAKGIRQRSSSFDAATFESLFVPYPAPPVQRKIAGLLDRETERIDALIDKKRRLIDLLEEKRTATITHAVTKGLDPTVPMKDSGIPAIGAIPRHWRAAQVRNVIRSITDGPFGSAFRSADYSSDGAAVVRLGNIRRSGYDRSDQAYIPLDLFATFTQFAVHEGDVLIAGLGDDRNHAGRACVAPDLGPAMVKGKCFRVRVDHQRVDAAYLSMVLSSESGASQVAARTQGSTRTMINLTITKDLRIPLPPFHEQTMIVQHLRRHLDKTNLLAKNLDIQLSLLAEYREALITAAVTGEIDVDTFDYDPNLEAVTP